MSRFFKSAAFPILIVVVLAFLAVETGQPGLDQPPHAQLPDAGQPKNSRTAKSSRSSSRTRAKRSKSSCKNKETYEVGYIDQAAPRTDQGAAEAHGVTLQRRIGKEQRAARRCSTYILPFVLFLGFWIFLMNQVQGGGSKVMSFGKSRAKRMSADSPKITFRDVAGVDEAVEELHEIKEFLENPKKFQALGARIPTGVLLYGPPGTGKTLLARAVAGEAGVPFFSISGSDFVEMFVGVGASRVRDLFEQAKQNSPCIIFMDEIDAVGRHRGAGLGGGHDEREQTLNQLLVEMDGFEAKDNIIMIAATNRPDILDPALLRPGRFDRQIAVDRPDRKGRAKILEVHTRGKPLAKVIDIDALAGQTPGFTGADLSNLINEAALLSARTGKREIGQDELEEGIMRVIAGPEKKTRVMSEKERLITAYHEMGHALVGHFLEHSDPVHKISVISRGQALGYTISMPQEDRFLTTRAELEDTMAMTLGGRAAEEIVFGEITTGASNDIEKVTATAKQMVMRFGMSEKLGPRVFGHDHGQPFLGREFSTEPDYSDEIAREIDDEVRRIIEAAHQRARDILTEHQHDLTKISEILVKRETIEKEEFLALLDGKSEEEVFGVEEEPDARAARARPRPPTAPERETPRPLPRPGLAGGTAELRGTRPRAPRARPDASRSRTADGSRASADARGRLPPDGDRQRHARLVLRRRAVPGRRRGASRTARSWSPRAPTSSTSAASRRGPGPSRWPRRRSCAACCRCSRALAAAAPARRSRSTPPRRRSRAPRSTPGASLVNDVSALRADPEMAGVVADSGADCCLMHMLGEPRTMQRDPRYEDVVDEVKAFLEERLAFAVARGHRASERDLLDPGIGFGKTVAHNLELLRRLDELRRARAPARDRHLAQELPRADRVDRRRERAHEPRRRARRATAAGHDRHQRARARARRERVPRARRRAGARRAGGGGCYVGRQMDGEEPTTTPTS